ncbi:SPFH domain-containing protein [uncultured Paracoccus sp.]|uniref:protease modulator HflC n=1 Tax=uncultured Paracoccus sp. TaxID=189685 RepID=UPI0026208F2B|nr:SPFH domain-containing protein [uncultured Paracoccus sp.]
MNRTLSMLALPALIAIAFLVMASVYIVDVREKALVTRFGEVVKVREEPGLGLKIPLIDTVVTYDARILGLPTDPMEVTPLDDRRLVVDAFARWQITDVVRFRRAVGAGGISQAQSRLEGILTNAIRGVLGSVPSTTVLSNDRTPLMNQIRDLARAEAESLGVNVIDVRLTRTDLPEQNLTATYARMRAEREREAADEIARGGEAAQRIRASADRTVVELTSEARRNAEVIRGEADATRNAIYADAYGRDPEFFAFSRSMQSYDRALQSNNSSIVMKPDSEFFNYLGDAAPMVPGATIGAGAGPTADPSAGDADGAPTAGTGAEDAAAAELQPASETTPAPQDATPPDGAASSSVQPTGEADTSATNAAMTVPADDGSEPVTRTVPLAQPAAQD